MKLTGLSLQLLQAARKFFADGGERIRYTFPPLIASGIKLARRYKAREAAVSLTSSAVSSLSLQADYKRLAH